MMQGQRERENEKAEGRKARRGDLLSEFPRMVYQCLSHWQVRDAGYVDASVRQEISRSSRAECCSCKKGSRTLKRKMDRQIDFSQRQPEKGCFEQFLYSLQSLEEVSDT